MTADWPGLSDKVCVITGGLGGLGRAMAHAFLGAGAKVLLLDRAPQDEAGAMADFAASGPRCQFMAVDVGDTGSVNAAFAACESRLGAPHVLVNNAAMSASAPLADLDLAAWERQMTVNVGGYLRCAQAFRRHRDASAAGAIVNIASIAGHNAQPGSGGYSMGKAAIAMLTRQLALEWGPDNIRTNSVSPGLFITPLSEQFYRHPDDRARREAVVPLRRIGDPAELADAVIYLSSPRASYVNGAEIVVDGGFSDTLMAHIPRAYGA
ncbi:SDR family NAD(P)-dependent oxidoreductase [Gemmobacter nectariphilus]|uniref:SDR family NAD(P)-dependent oxidoreductase n=1 Tax=Gemmobacter nectariphilus TaxID=220343 RepID=UPI00040CABBB|nr:SDR family oxidoreductase [Gemmobacter nectariphilus]